MHAYEDPATPDMDGLQQMDGDGIRVPVRLDQNVPVQILPSRRAVCFHVVSAADAEPVPLLSADLRRRRAVIVADSPAWMGDKELVRAGRAFLLPANVPVEIEHTEEVYVRARGGDDDQDPATVSVLAENWAD